uniref:Uncharacterized protein n=1 Tax=Rhizophora mucronata TaxID=61149 RepID=A0A2P2PS12_RHIMU
MPWCCCNLCLICIALSQSHLIY